MKTYRYCHRYHPLFPLNILVGNLRKKLAQVKKDIKNFIKLFCYATFITDILKKVDEDLNNKNHQ